MNRKGFTLIEILIATSIGALIVLGVFSSFQTGILSYRGIDSSLESMQRIRLLFGRLTRDLNNLHFDYANDSGFTGSSKEMIFISQIDSYNEGNYSLDLCRVKYSFNNDGLSRSVFCGEGALNKTSAVESGKLFFPVKDVIFEYAINTTAAEDTFIWQDSWPKDASEKNILPRAVRLTIALEDKDKRLKQARELKFNKVVLIPLGG